jgi:hypothetical protein
MRGWQAWAFWLSMLLLLGALVWLLLTDPHQVAFRAFLENFTGVQ